MRGSTNPTEYLRKTLDLIQSRALRASAVNWSAVRSKATTMAAGARTTADTYPAIDYALQQLGDNHSFLLGKSGRAVRSSKPAKTSGARPLPRVKSEGLIERGGRNFGLIAVAGFSGDNKSKAAKDFARDIQNKLSAMSQATPAGWIVDLRGNTGGNMWPMLVGIGPLLGKGTLGTFKYSKTAVPWFYENGTAGVIPPLGKHVNCQLPRSLADLPDAPVAILIDRTTMSSGEALAISFKGRPRTRFFGERTGGLTTANENFKLADGATLYLTTSIEQDRQGESYPEGIDPDVSVKQNSVPLGESNDPGIAATLQWLSTNRLGY
ncbi:MAG: S41 family peptidase [Candidatus Melainabacteria bacterium]|nr:S41 family peptidase [Candidatus Melainabacteria bacterium]